MSSRRPSNTNRANVSSSQETSPKPHGLDGAEFGWKVHGALDTWIGRVDTKASIVLAIEIAVAGFIVDGSAGTGQFAHLAGWHRTAYWAGSILLIGAVLASMLVVAPHLNRRHARRNWRDNFIYFGHLRHWSPKELQLKLDEEIPETAVLANQLVNTSKIAWRKHSSLQVSMILLALSAVAYWLSAR